MTADQLREAAFLLAPGFLTLKLFQLLGADRKRSEWEWTVWSVLVSLVIDLVTHDPVGKVVVAGALGFGAVVVWRSPLADPARPRLMNSAWDYTLDSAARAHHVVEVTVKDGPVYFGRLKRFAREETGAALWLYLTKVRRRTKDGSTWTRLSRTEGVLLHGASVRELRVVRSNATASKPATPVFRRRLSIRGRHPT